MVQIDGTLSQIEAQREALEGANTNTQVLNTMRDAAAAMKLAHKDMLVYLVLHSLSHSILNLHKKYAL